MTPLGGTPMLQNFITKHRDELIDRARAKVASRPAPRATANELTNGVPLFLTQLVTILEQENARVYTDRQSHSSGQDTEMGQSASQHGSELLQKGFTIGQVVHDYGDVCQAVTELALDLHAPIGTEDFHTLNRCLDNAIASAVTEYSIRRESDSSHAEATRQGILAHELRNHLSTAMLAFEAVKSGRVGVTGSTIGVLERSLRGLRVLVDRSMSEVRLASGTQQKERLPLSTFVEEAEIDASIEAANRGHQLSVEKVDDHLFVNVDRHLFASALTNLLQNALKFTRPSSHVWLRTRSTADRVSIEVEDQCGGLPAGASEAIFRPFEQHGPDRAGLGLGLSISRQAIEADGGTLTVRDLPKKGCVFTIEMPLAAGEPSMVAGR